MTREEIIADLYTDREFLYHGKPGAFCPLEKKCVGWDSKSYRFDTTEEAIDAPIFDGKSLAEIWDEIYPQIAPED